MTTAEREPAGSLSTAPARPTETAPPTPVARMLVG